MTTKDKISHALDIVHLLQLILKVTIKTWGGVYAHLIYVARVVYVQYGFVGTADTTDTALHRARVYYIILYRACFVCAGNTRSGGVAAQEESAGRPSAAERTGAHHPGRSVRVEFGPEGRDAPGRGGKRTAPSQPAALSSQSTHEGTCVSGR